MTLTPEVRLEADRQRYFGARTGYRSGRRIQHSCFDRLSHQDCVVNVLILTMDVYKRISVWTCVVIVGVCCVEARWKPSDCVPFYLCKNGEVITDGSGLLNIRSGPGPSSRLGISKPSPLCQDPRTVPCSVPLAAINRTIMQSANQQSFLYPGETPDLPTVPLKVVQPRRGCGVRRELVSTSPRINTGATHYAEFPWMMVLLLKERLGQTRYKDTRHKLKCGGSLIHPQVVITAAHCVAGLNHSILTVRGGEWDTVTRTEPLPHQDRSIQRVILHPNYNPSNLHNDIAVIIVDYPFELTDNVDTICLPIDTNFVDPRCIVTGWGKDSFNDNAYSHILKKVDLKILPSDECQERLRQTRLGKYFTLDESFVCADGEEGGNTCQVNGGSPIVCRVSQSTQQWTQVGIVSWGIECGQDNPEVNTKMSYDFVEWIIDQIPVSHRSGPKERVSPNCSYLEVCCGIPPGVRNLSSTTTTTTGLPPVDAKAPLPPVKTSQVPPILPAVITPTPGCGLRKELLNSSNILGGEVNTSATHYTEFPWMMAVLIRDDWDDLLKRYNHRFKCGGSLVHPLVVVTAAHCVFRVDETTIRVRGGVWDTENPNKTLPYQERSISQMIVHPSYNLRNLKNDIAVIIVDEPYNMTDNINTICLPLPSTKFDDSRCVVSGWGKDSLKRGNAYHKVLRKINLNVIPSDQCERRLRKTRLGKYFELHETFVCAEGKSDKNTCKGDGGGPLVCPLLQDPQHWTQVGIVSWGIGCDKEVPGVFTKFSHFVEWILLQIHFARVKFLYRSIYQQPYLDPYNPRIG